MFARVKVGKSTAEVDGDQWLADILGEALGHADVHIQNVRVTGFPTDGVTPVSFDVSYTLGKDPSFLFGHVDVYPQDYEPEGR